VKSVKYKPIGVIRSPFQDVEGVPIQPCGASGVLGTIEMEPHLEPGLKDLSGFSHIILIYHFHASKGYVLEVKPFLDDSLRGVFSTRAPRRPNPIGLSVVRLVAVERCTLRIQDVDVLDGTPLLDIKRSFQNSILRALIASDGSLKKYSVSKAQELMTGSNNTD